MIYLKKKKKYSDSGDEDKDDYAEEKPAKAKKAPAAVAKSAPKKQKVNFFSICAK